MDYKKPQSTLVQGGVGLYPLTTADQVILADGSRLEKDGKISADSAADSAKLGGRIPDDYVSSQGNMIKTSYNAGNSDVGIIRNTGEKKTQLIMSSNGYFYRVLDGSVFAIFDQGYLPWGQEGVIQITNDMMTNCSSHEISNCQMMRRCGIAIVSIAGIVVDANTAGQINLPIKAKFRTHATLVDIATKRTTLAYIDTNDSVLKIYPHEQGIQGGYFTIAIPIIV